MGALKEKKKNQSLKGEGRQQRARRGSVVVTPPPPTAIINKHRFNDYACHKFPAWCHCSLVPARTVVEGAGGDDFDLQLTDEEKRARTLNFCRDKLLSEEPQLQLDGAHGLWEMAVLKKHHADYHFKDVNALVRALRVSTAEVRLAAAAALWTLSVSASTRQHMLDAGAVQAIMMSIREAQAECACVGGYPIKPVKSAGGKRKPRKSEMTLSDRLAAQDKSAFEALLGPGAVVEESSAVREGADTVELDRHLGVIGLALGCLQLLLCEKDARLAMSAAGPPLSKALLSRAREGAGKWWGMYEQEGAGPSGWRVLLSISCVQPGSGMDPTWSIMAAKGKTTSLRRLAATAFTNALARDEEARRAVVVSGALGEVLPLLAVPERAHLRAAEPLDIVRCGASVVAFMCKDRAGRQQLGSAGLLNGLVASLQVLAGLLSDTLSTALPARVRRQRAADMTPGETPDATPDATPREEGVGEEAGVAKSSAGVESGWGGTARSGGDEEGGGEEASPAPVPSEERGGDGGSVESSPGRQPYTPRFDVPPPLGGTSSSASPGRVARGGGGGLGAPEDYHLADELWELQGHVLELACYGLWGALSSAGSYAAHEHVRDELLEDMVDLLQRVSSLPVDQVPVAQRSASILAAAAVSICADPRAAGVMEARGLPLLALDLLRGGAPRGGVGLVGQLARHARGAWGGVVGEDEDDDEDDEGAVLDGPYRPQLVAKRSEELLVAAVAGEGAGGDPALVEAVAAGLMFLASVRGQRNRGVLSGAVALLARPGAPEPAVHYLSAAIWLYARDPANRAAICALGGVGALIDAGARWLQGEGAQGGGAISQMEWVLAALWALASGGKDYIRDFGPLPGLLIVDGPGSGDEGEGEGEGEGGQPRRRVSFTRGRGPGGGPAASGVDVLRGVLEGFAVMCKPPRDGLVQLAVSLMRQLRHSADAFGEAFGAPRAVAALVAMVADGRAAPGARAAGYHLLLELASRPGAMRDLAGRAVGASVQLLAAGTRELEECGTLGCAWLSMLPAPKVDLVKRGAVERLVRLGAAKSARDPVQLTLLTALLNMSTTPGTQVAIAKRALTMLMGAASSDKYSPEARHVASCVLSNIARNPDNRSLIYRAELRVKARPGVIEKHTAAPAGGLGGGGAGPSEIASSSPGGGGKGKGPTWKHAASKARLSEIDADTVAPAGIEAVQAAVRIALDPHDDEELERKKALRRKRKALQAKRQERLDKLSDRTVDVRTRFSQWFEDELGAPSSHDELKHMLAQGGGVPGGGGAPSKPPGWVKRLAKVPAPPKEGKGKAPASLEPVPEAAVPSPPKGRRGGAGPSNARPRAASGRAAASRAPLPPIAREGGGGKNKGRSVSARPAGKAADKGTSERGHALYAKLKQPLEKLWKSAPPDNPWAPTVLEMRGAGEGSTPSSAIASSESESEGEGEGGGGGGGGAAPGESGAEGEEGGEGEGVLPPGSQVLSPEVSPTRPRLKTPKRPGEDWFPGCEQSAQLLGLQFDPDAEEPAAAAGPPLAAGRESPWDADGAGGSRDLTVVVGNSDAVSDEPPQGKARARNKVRLWAPSTYRIDALCHEDADTAVKLCAFEHVEGSRVYDQIPTFETPDGRQVHFFQQRKGLIDEVSVPLEGRPRAPLRLADTLQPDLPPTERSLGELGIVPSGMHPRPSLPKPLLPPRPGKHSAYATEDGFEMVWGDDAILARLEDELYVPEADAADAGAALEEEVWDPKASVFRPRLRESDSRDVYDNEDCLARMFACDWARISGKSGFQRFAKTGAELEEIRAILWGGYEVIIRAFAYYCALGTGGAFSMGLNEWTDFILQVDIPDPKSQRCRLKDCDTLFIKANVVEPGGKQEGKRDKKAEKAGANNERNALSRFEFLEIMARVAESKYGRSASGDISDALVMLIQNHLVARMAPEAAVVPNDFRRDRLYNKAVDLVFKQHLGLLTALYKYYKAQTRGRWFSLDHWMAFCKDMRMTLPCVASKRELTVVFVWAQMDTVDDLADFDKATTLTVTEFLEAVARAVDAIAVPTLGELRERGYSPEELTEYWRAADMNENDAIPPRASRGFLSSSDRPLSDKLEIVLPALCARALEIWGTGQITNKDKLEKYLLKKAEF